MKISTGNRSLILVIGLVVLAIFGGMYFVPQEEKALRISQEQLAQDVTGEGCSAAQLEHFKKFYDKAEVEEIVRTSRLFKQAVRSRDMPAIRTLLDLDAGNPYLDTNNLTNEDKFYLKRTFDEAFPKDWVKAVLSSPLPCEFANWRGVMMANGEVWFSLAERSESEPIHVYVRLNSTGWSAEAEMRRPKPVDETACGQEDATTCFPRFQSAVEGTWRFNKVLSASLIESGGARTRAEALIGQDITIDLTDEVIEFPDREECQILEIREATLKNDMSTFGSGGGSWSALGLAFSKNDSDTFPVIEIIVSDECEPYGDVAIFGQLKTNKWFVWRESTTVELIRR